MFETQWEIVRKFVFACKSSVCILRVPDSVITDEFKKDFCVIDVCADFSPYKPFLSVVSQNFTEKTLEYVEKNAYSVQKKSFLSFFKTGISDERFDIPLANELVYEQNRFIQTIVGLLEQLPAKNYLVLNSQCLFAESIQVIKALEKSNVKSKFAFCFTSEKNDLEQTEAAKFLEECSTKQNYLHLLTKIVSIAKDKTEYRLIFELPAIAQYKIILQTLRNNRIFMVLEQLKDFALWVSANFGKFDFEESEKRVLSLELAKSLFKCSLVDEAILYLNDIVDTQEEDEVAGAAFYYLARAFSFKKSISLAQKYYVLAEKIFQKENNLNYLALGAMLDFNIAKKISAEDTISKYQRALTLLRQQGFLNNFISVCISVPWKLVNDEASRKNIEDEVDMCLELAEKIDNQHLVSTACHWKGIICSHFGEIDKALVWYDKCNEIRTKIGELGPILNIRNGLCYDATCRAMYKRAFDLENGIINRLLEIGDFASVTDTLKNVAYALFYSRHFTEAYELFNVIARYLDIFNMSEMANSSFLPSQNDILIFKSIINFAQGDFIRGRINHSNIMQDLDSVTKEDRPFIYYIEAVLSADEKQIEASETFFEKCITEFGEIKSKLTHKIVFAYYEYAVVLDQLGYKKESEKYISKGFKIAKAEGYRYYTKEQEGGGKKSVSVKEYIDGVEKFEKLNLNLEMLNEKAEKEQLLTLLHKRIHDYQFINKVKTGYIKDMNLKKYIQGALMDIEKYTLAEEVYFCAIENGNARIYDSVIHCEKPSVNENLVKKLFAEAKKSDVSQMVYKEIPGLYFGDASYAEYKFGIIIVPSKMNPINVEILNTLNIALASIQSQVVIYKQEEHLMVMSSTDQLSRLKNRHAFQECIALESERVRRYQQRRETVIQIAVAFIDLDNFKYYNDTFGHSVGDLLIKSFASLLRETCRKIDFISRYGGDEFVIIMIDTNASEGKRVYNRLYECLRQHEYFLPQIKALLNRDDIDVPENRRLGFSMGISTNQDVEKCDDIDLVVQNADKALYYTKNNSKGSVSVWAEIKDMVK